MDFASLKIALVCRKRTRAGMERRMIRCSQRLSDQSPTGEDLPDTASGVATAPRTACGSAVPDSEPLIMISRQYSQSLPATVFDGVAARLDGTDPEAAKRIGPQSRIMENLCVHSVIDAPLGTG